MELNKRDDGFYWVGFQTEHGFKWRNTKATTKPEAEEVCRLARVSELETTAKSMSLTGEVLSAIMAGRKITCAKVMEEWVEWRCRLKSPATTHIQTYAVARFLRENNLAATIINRVDSEDIDAFVNAEDAGKRQNRLGRLHALRSYFDFASSKGYIVGSPAKIVEVNHRMMSHEQKEPVPRVPVTEEEFRKILTTAKGFHRWAVIIAYWAGLRIGDVATLEWASVTDSEIIVWTRKRDARVALPLFDPLLGGGELYLTVLEIMESTKKKGQFVFPAEAAIYLDVSKRPWISTSMSRLFERHKIPKTFHCLRHSFCTRLDAAGKSEKEIGRLVGHSNAETTRGYIHPPAVNGL